MIYDGENSDAIIVTNFGHDGMLTKISSHNTNTVGERSFTVQKTNREKKMI